MFAVHKQRDIILRDANGDIVDSDDEIPVFDLKVFPPFISSCNSCFEILK